MSDRRFEVVLREVGRQGGGDAELHVVRSRARGYEAREGRLDTIAFSDTLSLGLRVFRGNRMGFSYGFLGDDADLARMAEEASFCAESSDPDDAYGLPDAASLPPDAGFARPIPGSSTPRGNPSPKRRRGNSRGRSRPGPWPATRG